MTSGLAGFVKYIILPTIAGPEWLCTPLKPSWLTADEGSFVNLQHKHNFTMAHFGMMLGMMCQSLQGDHQTQKALHCLHPPPAMLS